MSNDDATQQRTKPDRAFPPPPIRPRRSLEQQIAYMHDQIALAQRQQHQELAETLQAVLETLLMVRDLAMPDHDVQRLRGALPDGL